MHAHLLAAAVVAATPTEEYNGVRQSGNNVGLAVLGAWGLASAAAGTTGLLLSHTPQWRGAHLANLSWGLINVGFAALGLYLGLRPGATRTERAEALHDGQQTQALYAFNVALDLGYVAGAVLLGAGFTNESVRGFARASVLQALWLLAFDAAMATFHFVNNERAR